MPALPAVAAFSLPATSIDFAFTGVPSLTASSPIVKVLPSSVTSSGKVAGDGVQPPEPLVKVTVCSSPFSSVYFTSTLSPSFASVGKPTVTEPSPSVPVVVTDGSVGNVLSTVIGAALVDTVSLPALSTTVTLIVPAP